MSSISSIENTTFFDRHYIKFIRDLLNRGLKMSPSPINADEIQFGKDQDLLRRIDGELISTGSDLIHELENYKKFIPIPDAVHFLVDTYHQHGTSVDALNILNLLVEDERTASFQELKAILKESADMPPGWAASLYAQSSLGRNVKSEMKVTSGLNLEAMRNFK